MVLKIFSICRRSYPLAFPIPQAIDKLGESHSIAYSSLNSQAELGTAPLCFTCSLRTKKPHFNDTKTKTTATTLPPPSPVQPNIPNPPQRAPHPRPPYLNLPQPPAPNRTSHTSSSPRYTNPFSISHVLKQQLLRLQQKLSKPGETEVLTSSRCRPHLQDVSLCGVGCYGTWSLSERRVPGDLYLGTPGVMMGEGCAIRCLPQEVAFGRSGHATTTSAWFAIGKTSKVVNQH
jgi:hypothetical protein